jgi:hypothetical protein
LRRVVVKEWKLQPEQDIGMHISPRDFSFPFDPDGYIVRCAHCDEVFFTGYRSNPEVRFGVLRCDACGKFSRFDGRPPDAGSA